MTRPNSGSTKGAMFSALLLRGVALGGRFLFVIFAAKYMPPHDLGRFGLLAALALIIPVIAGLECYQVLLRRILQQPDQAPETRQFYGAFVLVASLVSGTLGALTLAAFTWSTMEIAIGAVILMLEYIGLETYRNLINEHRPALAVFSIALRTGAWGVAIPALYFLGRIPEPWTFETVLWFWLAGAVGAAFVGAPLWPQFRPGRHTLKLRRSLTALRDVLGRSWMWVVYTASWRLMETGGRFICTWLLTEAAVGRFTVLSMLASLSYVAQKGVVEPVYYPRLSALDVADQTHRQFFRVSVAVVVGGTLCSALGLAASAWLSGAVPPISELVSFALLCLAFAFFSMSQPAHFRLYRHHKDRAIMVTGIAGCIAMLISSVAATWFWGIAGAAGGTMLGALVMLVSKEYAAKRLLT